MKKGFTLVEIMVVVAMIALLVAIAIPSLLRARVTANESSAQATLKLLSLACEMYASANSGKYPTSMDVLANVTPPYLRNNPIGMPSGHNGYNFSALDLLENGYYFSAIPVIANVTGYYGYTIITGGRIRQYPPPIQIPPGG